MLDLSPCFSHCAPHQTLSRPSFWGKTIRMYLVMIKQGVVFMVDSGLVKWGRGLWKASSLLTCTPSTMSRVAFSSPHSFLVTKEMFYGTIWHALLAHDSWMYPFYRIVLHIMVRIHIKHPPKQGTSRVVHSNHSRFCNSTPIHLSYASSWSLALGKKKQT